jgi:hypothetical protein
MRSIFFFTLGMLLPGIALAGPATTAGAGLWFVGMGLLMVSLMQVSSAAGQGDRLIRGASTMGIGVALLATSWLLTVSDSVSMGHQPLVLTSQVVVFGLLLLALSVANLSVPTVTIYSREEL